jgi:DNA-binding CsgD family transcriptional regulator
MRKARSIVLDADTRRELERLSRSRSESVRLTQRSTIILLAAAGLDNETIGEELGISRRLLSKICG